MRNQSNFFNNLIKYKYLEIVFQMICYLKTLTILILNCELGSIRKNGNNYISRLPDEMNLTKM